MERQPWESAAVFSAEFCSRMRLMEVMEEETAVGTAATMEEVVETTEVEMEEAVTSDLAEQAEQAEREASGGLQVWCRYGLICSMLADLARGR